MPVPWPRRDSHQHDVLVLPGRRPRACSPPSPPRPRAFSACALRRVGRRVTARVWAPSRAVLALWTCGSCASGGDHARCCPAPVADLQPDADKECADATLNYLDTWQSNFSSRGTPFFVAAGCATMRRRSPVAAPLKIRAHARRFQSPRLSWSYPQSVAKRYPPVRPPVAAHLLRPLPTHTEHREGRVMDALCHLSGHGMA